MKFTVTFKTPDALRDAVADVVDAQLEREGLDEDAKDEVIDDRIEGVINKCSRWFVHEEYVTLEIDTEAKTCIVKENK